MTHADWQRDVQSGIYMRSTRNQIKFFPESSHDDSNAGWPWTCPDSHYCHQRLAVLSSVPCIPSVYLLSPLSTIWHIHWQHCTLVSVSLFVLYILTSVCAVYSPLSLYSLFIIVYLSPFCGCYLDTCTGASLRFSVDEITLQLQQSLIQWDFVAHPVVLYKWSFVDTFSIISSTAGTSQSSRPSSTMWVKLYHHFALNILTSIATFLHGLLTWPSLNQ